MKRFARGGIIILVVCLLSLSVAVAATVHYFGKAQSLTTATHTAGAVVNPASQQSTTTVSPGVGKTQQPAITVSSSDVTVDFGNRQTSTYPIPSTFLGVGGVGLKLVVRNNNDITAIRQANFHLTKLGDYDFISQIFPTAELVTVRYGNDSRRQLQHAAPYLTGVYTYVVAATKPITSANKSLLNQ